MIDKHLTFSSYLYRGGQISYTPPFGLEKPFTFTQEHLRCHIWGPMEPHKLLTRAWARVQSVAGEPANLERLILNFPKKTKVVDVAETFVCTGHCLLGSQWCRDMAISVSA